jgi:hypothetical protein
MNRLYIIAVLLLSASVQAQVFDIGLSKPKEKQSEKEIIVRELRSNNENFLRDQRIVAEDVSRSKLGRQFRGSREDLKVLQDVVDRELIKLDDEQTLQSLGVVMGDIFVAERKDLNWKVYEDELGASFAVCLDDTQHCLFPITMLSRRMKVGLKPDVEAVFEKGLDHLRPYFPFVPYSGQEKTRDNFTP